MVTLAIDELPFFLGMSAPQQKHNAAALGVEGRNHPIGKLLPTEFGMGMRLTRFDRQYGIEQQYALFRPTDQVAMGRNTEPRNIPSQLLVDIDQGGRCRNTG